MITAIDINATREYVSKYDRPSSPVEDGAVHQPTIWIISTLDSVTRAKIEEKHTQFAVSGRKDPEAKADMFVNHKTKNVEVVRYGLKGWRNFNDTAGKPVQADMISEHVYGGKPRNVLTLEAVRQIPPLVIEDLAEQIMGDSTLDEAAEKNS